MQASNRLRCWGMVNGPPTYHDLIARDKEVVKSVLLLTGSIEHIKQQVAEYLANFDKYSFLWTQDLQVGCLVPYHAKAQNKNFNAMVVHVE
jgi:dynein heavy chain